jgi:hypothetical protein
MTPDWTKYPVTILQLKLLHRSDTRSLGDTTFVALGNAMHVLLVPRYVLPLKPNLLVSGSLRRVGEWPRAF